jgi:hypothetical protein
MLSFFAMGNPMDYTKKVSDIRKQTEEFCREKRYDQNSMITWVLFCELIDALKSAQGQAPEPTPEPVAPTKKPRRKKDNAGTVEAGADGCII